ncbi:hypothetical protein CC80DRAFT_548432 [Byssothecium circinans]|uniref:Uncharacterized protein n=1 Tax=Byssothecium circinans TaxID=147558 RepID=A0A6A5TWW2_9PLEO|nr:hypothetical protein CC80DRAFT_548432 [Byssothecium circinans]
MSTPQGNGQDGNQREPQQSSGSLRLTTRLSQETLAGNVDAVNARAVEANASVSYTHGGYGSQAQGTSGTFTMTPMVLSLPSRTGQQLSTIQQALPPFNTATTGTMPAGGQDAAPRDSGRRDGRDRTISLNRRDYYRPRQYTDPDPRSRHGTHDEQAEEGRRLREYDGDYSFASIPPFGGPLLITPPSPSQPLQSAARGPHQDPRRRNRGYSISHSDGTAQPIGVARPQNAFQFEEAMRYWTENPDLSLFREQVNSMPFSTSQKEDILKAIKDSEAEARRLARKKGPLGLGLGKEVQPKKDDDKDGAGAGEGASTSGDGYGWTLADANLP